MDIPAKSERAAVTRHRRSLLSKRVWRSRYLYLMILPTLIYFFIFSYIPYYGLTIAFRDFKIFLGIGESPWVGLKYFRQFFNSPDFVRLLRNTVLISTLRIAFGFPVPIIFALMLNEVRHPLYKRTVQTVTYFPNFLSWVVYAGIMLVFIAPTGVINMIMRSTGRSTVPILTRGTYFLPMLIITDVLKGFGFGAIIYLAALAGIDPQLYEAAVVDGANKWQQVWNVTLPGIRPTIILMLILALGGLMNAGFDQVFQFYNASVLDVADIIDTFVYRIGLQSSQYSLGTAVGMFKGVIGLILIVTANSIVRRSGEYSIW